MAIIDETYLRRVMPREEFSRVFDKNGVGVPDSTAIASAIAIAESTALSQLNGGRAVQVPLTGEVDEMVKIMVARIAVYEAVRFSLSDGVNGAKSPYRQGYEDAISFLQKWRKDEVRPPVVNGGAQPGPRASVVNILNTDGNDGGAYDRQATGRDRTGF